MPIGTTQFSNFPYYERLDLLLAASCDSGRINVTKQSELVRCELTEPLRAHAFGIDAGNVRSTITHRAEIFNRYIRDDRLRQLPLYDCNPTLCLRTLWRFWLPLAIDLVALRNRTQRPVIQAFLGGQGTGKTTLARALCLLLDDLGFPAIALSLDDLYQTHADRAQLKARDPRFVRRGPPGTHDIALGLDVLERVKSQRFPVAVPRFDKSLHQGDGDRVAPIDADRVEILLFEGWFVGVEPVDDRELVSAIASETEADRQFACDCNAKLQEYRPLWAHCDRLAALKPADYRLSQQWRQQAEREAIAQKRDGMDDAAVAAFVSYFWKALPPDVIIAPQIERAQLIVCIEADHSVGHIYGRLAAT